MRAFKIWNKNRTSSFDLSGLNVITTDIAGLGNRFTNELYDGRIKKHLIHQYNSFEQINLTVNFGVNSNAYQKYREFMNFIQANGRNILVIEYYSTGASRFVDVVLSNASKSQKTGFGVLVETVTFDRLTPYYIKYKRTGTSTLVSNNYMENVMPKITMSGRTYPAGTKIRVKSKNLAVPDLTGKEYLGNGIYRVSNVFGTTIDYNVYNGYIIINGTHNAGTRIFYLNGNTVFDNDFVMSAYYIAGDNTDGGPYIRLFDQTAGIGSQLNPRMENPYDELTYQDISSSNLNVGIVIRTDASYDNFTFRVQLEKAGNALELDRPIDELNGYTLREWFNENQLVTNGDFSVDSNSDGLADGWNNYAVAPTFSILNGQRMQYTNNSGSVQCNGILASEYISASNGDKIYIRIKAKKDASDTNTRILLCGLRCFNGSLELGNLTAAAVLTTSFDFYSNVITLNNASINQYKPLISRAVNDTQVSDFTVYDFMQFNITKLIANKQYSPLFNTTFDLMSDAQIKEQMDAWINEYQTLKETPTEYSIPITDTREIELNETILSNQELIIDSENKSVTLNGANAYQITNKDKATFLNLPDGDYLIECDYPIELEYKKWVID